MTAHTALRYEGRTWSHAAVAGWIDAETRTLAALGVCPGDRVAVLALNHPRTLVLLLACARLGAMLAPLNWRLAGPELQWIVDDADPRVLFVDGTAPAPARDGMLVRPLHEWDEGTPGGTVSLVGDGPALLVYTSGTTGRPKGAVLTAAALRANAALAYDMHGPMARDHVLTVLPLFHVGGLNIQTLPALLAGGCVTVLPRFDAGATLIAIGALRPTLTVLVPATMQAIVAHPDWAATDLSCLRAVATGSTVVQPEVVAPFTARGVDVLQVYGSTETAPIAIYVRAGEAAGVLSTGRPGPGVEARTHGADGVPGEIWLRGPQLFQGYWHNPAATAEALVEGWYRTGDIGTRATDGSWTVHDRAKHMIVSGGENIYPAEIERVLATLPQVAECAVVGRPDPRWQEVPEAHVVLRPGATCTELEVVAHVQSQLARFKAPRRVVFVDALPRNAMGKVEYGRLAG